MFVFIMRVLVLLLTLFASVDNKFDSCSMRDSCANSSFSTDEVFIQSRNCFCDSFCRQYDDCCNDSLHSRSHLYECTDFLSPIMISNRTPLFHPLSIWMRTKCLINYQGSSLDHHCRNFREETFLTNPILFIPVTSLATNITYRNYFCAFCNNEPYDQLVSWQLKVFCRANGSQLDQLMINEIEQMQSYFQNVTRRKCLTTIRYPHVQGRDEPSVFIRPCKKTLPSICPSDTPVDLARNCSISGPRYRYDLLSKLTYSNPYCAQCHHRNNHSITCFDPNRPSVMPPMTQIRTPPLSILFDPRLLQRYFTFNSSIDAIYSRAYHCRKPNELYDLFRKKCSLLTHSNRTMILSIHCQSPIQTFENYLHFPNGSLYLINQSILLRKDQYVFLSNEQIVFCTDHWKEYLFPFYRNLLSIISTSISLFCLLIFIVAFCLLPSLHNLPGKCLLSLSISLFFGQLIFISTSNIRRSSSLCFLSAVLIHYFYLSSFIWLLIIAKQIHSTFARQTIQQHSNHPNFYLYHLVVACSTGLIILIACLLQFIRPQSTFSPAYGLLFCAISQSNAMILFFLFPIGLSLLLIAVLFCKTILAISHSQQISRLARNDDQHFVLIYARLACLMGLQWLLLILALILQRTWLWIIFEMINSLPGAFICLGFLSSSRIWKRLTCRRQSLKSNATPTNLMSPVK